MFSFLEFCENPFLRSRTCSSRKTAPGTHGYKISKFSIFKKIQFFGIFPLSGYISAYFDDTMRRAMKKHADCLIFT